jgi:RHS repeat-associated protein
VHHYQYDEAGFVTSRDGVTLDWDGAGRIRAIGANVSFVWDTDGRLVSTVVDGIERRRLFGGVVEADETGSPTAIELGEVRVDLETGERLYRHYDARGNVKFTTNEQGEVVAHYHYSAYGVEAVYGEAGSVEEDRSFARGREYAGFLLLGTRLYEPHVARFLAPDPVYQLVNQYAYTLGNPLFYADPEGMFPSIPTTTAESVGGAVGDGAAFALMTILAAKAVEKGRPDVAAAIAYATPAARDLGKRAGRYVGRKVDVSLQSFVLANVAPRFEFYFEGFNMPGICCPHLNILEPLQEVIEGTEEVDPRRRVYFSKLHWVLGILLPLQLALGNHVLRSARGRPRVAGVPGDHLGA